MGLSSICKEKLKNENISISFVKFTTNGFCLFGIPNLEENKMYKNDLIILNLFYLFFCLSLEFSVYFFTKMLDIL